MDIHCSRPDFSLSHKQVNVFIAAVSHPSRFFALVCPVFPVGRAAGVSAALLARRPVLLGEPRQYAAQPKRPEGSWISGLVSPPLGVKVRGSRQNISAAL